MKCLAHVVLVVIGTLAAYGDTVVDANRLCLSIVVDRSASSQWSQIQLIASQTVAALKAGEFVNVIVAETDTPILYAGGRIGSYTMPNRDDIYSFLGHLKQIGWGGQANLAQALSAAFGELERYGPASKCAIVVTDGKLSNEQVRQIRNLATVYKARGWPLCITADRSAHSEIFLAGRYGEFKVMLLNQANLDSWLNSIRPVVINEATEKKTDSSLASAPEPKPTPKPGDQPAATIFDVNQLRIWKTLQKDVNEVKDTVNKMSKNYTVMFPPDRKSGSDGNKVQRPTDDSNKSEPNSVTPDINHPAKAPRPPHTDAGRTKEHIDANKPSTDTKKAQIRSWWQVLLRRYGISGVGAIALIAFIFIIIVNIKNIKRDDKKKQADQNIDELFCLVAIKDDTPYPLGIESSIKRLVFGSSPVSAVPISGEGIEAEVFTLSNKGREFKLRNTSSGILHVNGVPLKAWESLPVIFPLSVQSDNGFSMVITRKNVKESVASEGESKNEI